MPSKLEIDTEFDSIFTTMEDEQADQMTTNGCYLQFRQGEMADGFSVHVHKRKQECGWSLIARATEDGKEYLRSKGFGELGITKDWYEITE